MENYTRKTKKVITHDEAFDIFNKIRGGILIIAIALIFIVPLIH